MTKHIARHTLATLPLLLALAALLAFGGRGVSAPWGETNGPAFTDAQITAWTAEIVAEQVADLGCDTTPALTERVAVRNAHGLDTGVVRIDTFDRAWTAAQRGDVYVVGWCRS